MGEAGGQPWNAVAAYANGPGEMIGGQDPAIQDMNAKMDTPQNETLGGGMGFQGIASMAGALGGLGMQIASMFNKPKAPKPGFRAVQSSGLYR